MVLKAVLDVHASAVVSVRCFVPRGAGGSLGAVGGIGGGAGMASGVGVVAAGVGGVSGNCDPAVITVDIEGVVNKMSFRRVMWTKWVVDTECLLDGERDYGWRGGGREAKRRCPRVMTSNKFECSS